jgi:hypothetical protein
VELHAMADKLVASLPTVHGQLTVAINHLRSEKILQGSTKDDQTSGGLFSTTARHGHMLLFMTNDELEDPLPWLNWCD